MSMFDTFDMGPSKFIRRLIGLGADDSFELLEYTKNTLAVVYWNTHVEDFCGLCVFFDIGSPDRFRMSSCYISRQEDIDRILQDIKEKNLESCDKLKLAERLAAHLGD